MAYTSTSDVVDAAKRILIVVLFLLNIKGGVSQCLIPRVERSRNYASETSPLPGSDFYVVVGQPVRLFCYCPEHSQFERVEMLQGEQTIESHSSCETLLHTILNASYADEGKYICRAHNDDGQMTTNSNSLGNMTIIDPAVVQAEPRQYGQLNTQTKLLCNTSLDINDYHAVVSWFTGHGQTKVAIESSGNGSLIINNTQFTHGGVYTCQVYFATIDIRIEKIVELVIIDSPATTFSPSSIPVAPPTTTPLPSSMTPPTTTPTPNGRPNTTSSNTTATVTPVESTSVLVTILAVLGTSLAISSILLLVLITYVVLHCFKVHKCYYQSQEEKCQESGKEKTNK